MSKKLYVMNARLAFALPEDQNPDELFDTANMMLIPQQIREGGEFDFVDYQFEGEPILSLTTVENYDHGKGFEVPKALNLYYVRAEQEYDGADISLLVEAESVEAATKFWRDHFDEVLGEGADPMYVGLVPLTGVAGAVSWSKVIPDDYDKTE